MRPRVRAEYHQITHLLPRRQRGSSFSIMPMVAPNVRPATGKVRRNRECPPWAPRRPAAIAPLRSQISGGTCTQALGGLCRRINVGLLCSRVQHHHELHAGAPQAFAAGYLDARTAVAIVGLGLRFIASASSLLGPQIGVWGSWCHSVPAAPARDISVVLQHRRASPPTADRRRKPHWSSSGRRRSAATKVNATAARRARADDGRRLDLATHGAAGNRRHARLLRRYQFGGTSRRRRVYAPNAGSAVVQQQQVGFVRMGVVR